MAAKNIDPKEKIDHKKEFAEFVNKVGAVYGSIAEKIEELLEVLNTTDRSKPNISELVDSIVRFLRGLEESVILEEKKAKKILSGPKKKSFLVLIHEELFKIKELEVYLALAERKQKPEIITKIHQLYSQIEKEIAAEETSLK